MNIRPVSSKHDTDALLDQSKLKCALKVNFWIRTLNWKLTQLTQLLVNTDIKTSTTLGNVKEIQQLSVKKDFLIYSVLWPFLNHFQAETTCPVIHSHLCSASFLQPVRSPERERRQGGHKIAKKKTFTDTSWWSYMSLYYLDKLGYSASHWQSIKYQVGSPTTCRMDWLIVYQNCLYC